MMPDGQANDGSIHGVDVGEVAFHSARMREGEFRVHRRVKMLLGE